MFNFLEKLGALLLYSFEVAFLVCCSLFMYNGLWVIFLPSFSDLCFIYFSLVIFFREKPNDQLLTYLEASDVRKSPASRRP